MENRADAMVNKQDGTNYIQQGKYSLERKFKQFVIWNSFQGFFPKSWKTTASASRKETSQLYIVETAHCVKYWNFP